MRSHLTDDYFHIRTWRGPCGLWYRRRIGLVSSCKPVHSVNEVVHLSLLVCKTHGADCVGAASSEVTQRSTELMDMKIASEGTKRHIYKHRMYLLIYLCSFAFQEKDLRELTKMHTVRWD